MGWSVLSLVSVRSLENIRFGKTSRWSESVLTIRKQRKTPPIIHISFVLVSASHPVRADLWCLLWLSGSFVMSGKIILWLRFLTKGWAVNQDCGVKWKHAISLTWKSTILSTWPKSKKKKKRVITSHFMILHDCMDYSQRWTKYIKGAVCKFSSQLNSVYWGQVLVVVLVVKVFQVYYSLYPLTSTISETG